MENEILLQVQGLSKCYGSGHTQVTAVDGVSLEIRRGELVLIMGPSGSGKTTLLSMLGGLLTPDAGQVIIDGVDLTVARAARLPDIRARKIGFIFQAFNLMEELTVEENILFPAQLVEGGIAAARERGTALIDRLGLGKRRRALPRTLSGGEKQRVAIARALINRPPLILADEPTGNLDSQSGQDVMMILHDIARDDGCAVLLVTHDPRVEEVADRLLWLEDGVLRGRRMDQPSWVHCPVCNMRVDERRAERVGDYQGRSYVFCSERCQQRFMENPAGFIR